MHANYNEKEINSLLLKVRIFNKDIGSFQIFAITEDFEYVVKLSNGKILVKLEELQDDDQGAITPDKLLEIANRFIPSTSMKTSQQQSVTSKSKINEGSRTQKKKNRISKGFLVIIITLLVLVVGTALLYNLNISDDNGSGETYQEKVMTIEEIEQSQPTNFLSASGTYRENFWGDKIIINCIITNKATVATYKDAIIRIKYYTKTQTELGSKDYTVYEVFQPNSKKTIELTIDKFKDVSSIGWDVNSATVY